MVGCTSQPGPPRALAPHLGDLPVATGLISASVGTGTASPSAQCRLLGSPVPDGLLVDLPAMEVEGRIDRLRPPLAGAGCDAARHEPRQHPLPDRVLRLGRASCSSARTTCCSSPTAAAAGHRPVGRQRRRAHRDLGHASVSCSEQAPRGSRLGLEAGAVTWAQQRRYDDDCSPPPIWSHRRLRRGAAHRQGRGEVATSRPPPASPTPPSPSAPPAPRGPTESSSASPSTPPSGASAPRASFETIGLGAGQPKPHHRPGDRRVVEGTSWSSTSALWWTATART